ncbi:MAG: isoprenylcysteine carboxyl methyltransferase family protein [Rhizomicrobium sp.]
MIWIAYVIVLLVVMQRLGELVLANRNTRKLKAEGGVEIGAAHYPLIVFLHGAWLLAILWLLPAGLRISWPWLGAFVLLQIARLWAIASLGRYWTTRIISLPRAPLVKKGPYRFLRHPNYVVVAGEILALPMAFSEWGVAALFSLANGLLLLWRIREEETGLAPRRNLS